MGAPDAAWAAFRAAPVDPITRHYWRISADLVISRVEACTAYRDRVLDVGCGTGATTLALCTADRRCVGIDTSPDAVAAATAAATAAGVETAFSVAPAEALPFDDRTFDAVLLASVLQHVDDPHRALAEAWRVLAPHGTLVVSVPQTLRAATRRQPGLYTTHVTLASLTALLAAAGFRVTSVTGSGLLLPATRPVLLRVHAVTDATPLFDGLEAVARALPRLASNLVVTARPLP